MSTLTSKLIVALVDQATAPARAITSAMNQMTAASRANAARMAEVRGKMVDAVGMGYALYESISAPIDAAMKFESAMADVRKVVDFPAPEAFRQMGEDISRMSTEIPMAATDIAAIVAAAGQSGIDVNELLPFAEMAAKVGVAWEVSADNAGEALAKLKTALGRSVEETGLLADAINHLGNNSAASAPAILDVVRRVAPMASQFGLSAEQAAAFGAAMVGSGFEAEVASTSFLNMGRALTRGASATKRQAAAYSSLGLDAEKVAAGMQKDAVGTIGKVLDKLRAVPAAARAALISDLFGDEARALAPLIGNAKLLTETLGLIADKTKYAGSAAEEYAIRAQTTENNLQLFRNQIDRLARSIGNALLPALNDILALVGPVVSSISDLASRFPNLTLAVVGVTAALVGFRVAAIASQYAGLFLKGAFLDAGIAALTAARAIGSMALAPAGAALMALRNPLRLVTGAFYALRVAVIGTGIGAILAGVALAGAWIYNNWAGITIAFEAFRGAFLRAITPIMPMLQPVANGFAWLGDIVSSIVAPIDEMGAGWARAGIAVGRFAGETLTAVTGFASDMATSIASAWQTMSWSEIGQAAAQGIGDGFLFVSGWMTDLLGAIDWRSIWDGAVYDAVAMIDAVTEYCSTMAEDVVGFFRGIDWAVAFAGVRSAAANVTEWVTAAFSAIDWLGVWNQGAAIASTVFRRLGSAISSALDSIEWTGFIVAASDAISWVYNSLTATLQSIDWGNLGFTLGEKIAVGLSGVADIGRIALNSLAGAGVSGIGSSIASGILAFDWIGVGSAILRYIGTAFRSVSDFIGGVFSGLKSIDWASVWSTAVSAATAVWSRVAAYAVDIFSAASTALASIDWTGLWSAAVTAASSAFSRIGSLVSGALGSIDWAGAIGTIRDAISSAADSLLSMDWAGVGYKLGYNLGEMLAVGAGGVDWLGLGYAILRLVATAFQGGAAFIGSMAAGLAVAAGQRLLAAGKALMQSMWDGAKAKGDAMVAWAKGIPARIGAAVSELTDRLMAGGKALMQSMWDGAMAKVDDTVAWAREIPVRIGAAVSDLTGRLMAGGQDLMQSMWDGVMAKVDAMVEWFRGLPDRIVAAIGNIDLGSLIEWGGPPEWLSRWWPGAGEGETPAATSASAQAPGAETSSRITAAAAAANDNPQHGINTMLEAMDRLAVEVAEKGEAASTAARNVGSAISENISVTSTPIIDTSSIDAARAKVDALSRTIQSMPSTAVTATSAALAGARASGGPVLAGGSYLVGEKGPEIVTFGQDGFVHDAMKTARIIRNATLGAAAMALPAAAMPSTVAPGLIAANFPAIGLSLPEMPALGMSVPDLPSLGVSLPDLPSLAMSVPDLPALDIPEFQMPEVRLPAVPQVDWPQSGGQGADQRQEGRKVDIQIAAGAITVNAAAGQSPERIADEVVRRVSAQLNALSRGAFSDGAN